jgi:non-ribosomal peptide synthetase component F
MTDQRSGPTGLPRAQQSIRDRCVHPSGGFRAFRKEEVEQTISDRFEQKVAEFPDRVAVKTRRLELTYAELNRAANRVAQRLRAECGDGVEPVALLFEPSVPAVCATLGGLKAGKACVALDPAYPLARTRHILEDSQARVILTDRHHRALAREWGGQVIDLDEIDAEDDGTVERTTSADSLACLIYTSGSTGRPKGVAQSHRNLLHLQMNYTNALRICPDDRLTMLRSMTVIGGMRDLFAALLNGAALYPFDFKG